MMKKATDDQLREALAAMTVAQTAEQTLIHCIGGSFFRNDLP